MGTEREPRRSPQPQRFPTVPQNGSPKTPQTRGRFPTVPQNGSQRSRWFPRPPHMGDGEREPETKGNT